MNTRSGSADELDPGAYGSGHGFKLKTGNWESSRSPCRVLVGSGMDGSSVCLSGFGTPRDGWALLPGTRGWDPGPE